MKKGFVRGNKKKEDLQKQQRAAKNEAANTKQAREQQPRREGKLASLQKCVRQAPRTLFSAFIDAGPGQRSSVRCQSEGVGQSIDGQ